MLYTYLMEWDIDLSQIRGLRRWYGNMPSKMRIACAEMLNHFAFGTRRQAIKQIGDQMTIRNEKFITGRMRVTKAIKGQSVAMQRSMTGSIATQRFSGWVEQEYGTRTARKRFATLAGRGGSIGKQIRQIARLKPSAEVVKVGDEGYDTPRGGKSNQSGFFAMAQRKKENRLLMVKNKNGKMFLYKRKRSTFELVQILQRKQPKKKRWLAPARAIYFKRTDLVRLWESTVTPLMGKPPKR